MHKLIPLLVLLATAEWAQTQDNRNYSQTFPIRVDQQTPGTCQMWEFFIASTDGHVYECWSPNKWGNLITLNFSREPTISPRLEWCEWEERPGPAPSGAEDVVPNDAFPEDDRLP